MNRKVNLLPLPFTLGFLAFGAVLPMTGAPGVSSGSPSPMSAQAMSPVDHAERMPPLPPDLSPKGNPRPLSPPNDPAPPPLTRRYPALEGLDPRARGPLLSVVPAWRVCLTRHRLPESSGMHEPEPGSVYTAAADIYVLDLPPAEIRAMLDRLGRAGFAAWFRIPGRDGWPSRYLPHVHAVYAGVPLKSGLRAQVRDYLNGKTGLRSHGPYRFHRFDPQAVATVRRMYAGKPQVTRRSSAR
ncbi:MAG: hypothetical protein KY468_00405 [Armatimonadetes bacterium]|nr:hypothetical protein [Armatimonadota bacterium]